MAVSAWLRTFAIGAAALAPVVVAAADSASHHCAKIKGDAERLACYDASYPPVGIRDDQARERAATTAAAPAAPPPLPMPGTAADEFGMTPHAQRKLNPAAHSDKPASITASVTKVDLRRDGRWVVTLDNGHVWQQIETVSEARVRVGDSITVREAALGSHLLVTTSRIATRVRRVR